MTRHGPPVSCDQNVAVLLRPTKDLHVTGAQHLSGSPIDGVDAERHDLRFRPARNEASSCGRTRARQLADGAQLFTALLKPLSQFADEFIGPKLLLLPVPLAFLQTACHIGMHPTLMTQIIGDHTVDSLQAEYPISQRGKTPTHRQADAGDF